MFGNTIYVCHVYNISHCYIVMSKERVSSFITRLRYEAARGSEPRSLDLKEMLKQITYI